MEQYKIKRDGFNEIRKKLLLLVVPLLLLAYGAGIAMSFGSASDRDRSQDKLVLSIVAPLFLLVMAVSLFMSMRQRKAIFESLILTFDGDKIIREQLRTPTVSIDVNGIKEIRKAKNGSLVIFGLKAADIIIIPAQLEGIVEVEWKLMQIATINVQPDRFNLFRSPLIVGAFTVGSMGCVYLATNKIVVFLSGLFLTSILIWSFIEMRRSKNLDNKIRRQAWWIFVVIASIVVTVITKLCK